MKIPLHLVNDRIIATIVISCKNYRISYKPIQFIVDTGSTQSFISEGDALRIQIPTNRLDHFTNIRMGGSSYHLLKTKPFSFILKNNEGKAHKIELSEFYVAKTDRKLEEARQESKNFPSILGINFLKTSNLSLHFYPSKNECYFIKEE